MILKVKNLTITKKNKSILSNVTVELGEGIHGLLGANGAGKTTFIRSILGLYVTKTGVVTYNGLPLKKSKIMIGYLPQQFGLFPSLKVSEMMRYMAVQKKVARKDCNQEIESCLEAVGLLDQADKKVKELSGGMLRRLGIAQALLGNPKLLVLDEPTAGLDPEERLRMKQLIYEIKKDRIIIISTHIIEDLENLCDFIEVLQNGELIYEGDCTSLVETARNKIFEINKEQYIQNVTASVVVIKEYEKDGMTKLRVASGENLDAEILEPTIEDGYICIQNKLY